MENASTAFLEAVRRSMKATGRMVAEISLEWAKEFEPLIPTLARL
jgi:hypothetical protein